MMASDQRDGPECTISNMPQKQRCCPASNKIKRGVENISTRLSEARGKENVVQRPMWRCGINLLISLSLNEREQSTIFNN